jgi:hypothetical protein
MICAGWMRRCASLMTMRRISWIDQRVFLGEQKIGPGSNDYLAEGRATPKNRAFSFYNFQWR